MKSNRVKSKAPAATEASTKTKKQSHVHSNNTATGMSTQDKSSHLAGQFSLLPPNEKEEYIKLEAAKVYYKTGVTLDAAIEVVQSRISRVLDDRDILFSCDDSGDFITVGELLDAGDMYNRKAFLDPLFAGSSDDIQNLRFDANSCWFKWEDSNPLLVGKVCPECTKYAYEFRRIKEIEENKKFRFLNTGNLPSNSVNWLIRDYLEAEKVALIFGSPSSFKTFMVLDMGLSIAAGRDWHGHKVDHGAVFYICGEGLSGIDQRISAWTKHHNLSADNFFISSSSVQMLSADCLEEIEVAAKKALSTAAKPKLIIIDTLNRNFGDGDENSTVDMTRFIQGIDRLSRKLRCAIIVLHHSGLNDSTRSRGSSALLGAVDFAYSCKVKNQFNGEKIVTFRSTKTKDHALPEPKTFKPLEIETGKDGVGNPISSLVLVEASASAPSAAKAIKLTTAQQIALDALTAVSTNGDASVDAWRAEAYRNNISAAKKADSKRKAFARALKDLFDKGLVLEVDGLYRLS